MFHSSRDLCASVVNFLNVSGDLMSASISIGEFQQLIRDMYLEKDLARGVDGTFMWLMEEVGELASALRNGTHEERLGEVADGLARLAPIPHVVGGGLNQGIPRKYGS